MSPLARCDTFRIHRAESCRNPRVFGEAFKPAHDLANDPERGRPQWSCAALMAFLETLTKVNRSSQRHRRSSGRACLSRLCLPLSKVQRGGTNVISQHCREPRFSAVGNSPDRLDALVWAATELLVEPKNPGLSTGAFSFSWPRASFRFASPLPAGHSAPAAPSQRRCSRPRGSAKYRAALDRCRYR